MKQIQQTIIAFFVLVTTMVSAQEPSLTLKGKVYDKGSEKGINQASVRLFDVQGNALKSVVTDAEGEYQMELQTSSNRFKVEAQATDYNQAEVTVDSSKKNIEINFGLDAQESSIEQVSLPMVYFDFDSSYLTAQAKEELKKVLAFMESNPTAKLRVNAHTDTRGSNGYNNWLSARRAERVKNWLIHQGGIATGRIEEHYFGKKQLSNICGDGILCSKEQHQQNRRCSFEIVN